MKKLIFYFQILLLIKEFLNYEISYSNHTKNENNFKLQFLNTNSDPKCTYKNLKDDLSDLMTIFKEEMVDQLIEFLVKNSNTSLIYEAIFGNKECKDSFTNTISDKNNIYNIINNSGKDFSDIGQEDECESNNLFYLFLEYKVNSTIFFANNTEHSSVYKFLGQTSFYSGLCVLKECKELYDRFFDIDENPEFFEFLSSNYGIVDIKNYSMNPIEPKELYKIIFYIVIVYIILKILISIIGFIIFSVSFDESILEEEEMFLRQTQISQPFQTNLSSNHNNNTQINLKSKLTFLIQNKYSKFTMIFYKLYKFMGIKSNLKYIYKLKGKYYDDRGLEYISFFRFFLLFWIIFNHNIYALLKIPHREFTNVNFFQSIWFTIIKYSSFATECWVLLDGFVFSYKLMSYLKKQNENKSFDDYSFKIFFRFYSIIFTKMFLFFFVFFGVHVYFQDFAGMIKDSPIIQYFIENINNKSVCQSDPLSIFIPFYIQYKISDKFSNNGFKNCYRFVNIITNEFYSSFFILIIFYLSYTFKNKIFDYSVAFIFLLNTIFTYLAYSPYKEGEIYSFGWILGDNLGQTFTHLFINSYFLGVLTGLVYFYYNDVISSNPIENNQNFITFRFTYEIMKFFDQRGKFTRRIFFMFSVFLQFLCSTTFFWYFLFFNEQSKQSSQFDFNIKINPIIFFFSMYEKKIFLILFIFMLLNTLIYPKMTSLKLFVQSNVFIPFSRTDFACFCIVDTCVYLFYSAYNLQIYLNLQNMFIISSGLIIIVFVVAMMFWLLFELPFRIIFKNFMKFGW